jgi:hypothetical protein
MRDQRQMRILEDKILRMDPLLDRHDIDVQLAIVVVAAAFITGPDVDRLINFTGYLRKFVTDISQRMHAAGRWENGIAHSEHYLVNEQLNPVPVFLDCLVAEGSAVVCGMRNGEAVYAAVGPPPSHRRNRARS